MGVWLPTRSQLHEDRSWPRSALWVSLVPSKGPDQWCASKCLTTSSRIFKKRFGGEKKSVWFIALFAHLCGVNMPIVANFSCQQDAPGHGAGN